MLRLALLLSVFAAVDLSTPIVPVGQTIEWDDEEEVAEVRRNSRPRPARIGPVSRATPVARIRIPRPAMPARPAGNPPGGWFIPLRQSRLASSEPASPPEDH